MKDLFAEATQLAMDLEEMWPQVSRESIVKAWELALLCYRNWKLSESGLDEVGPDRASLN